MKGSKRSFIQAKDTEDEEEENKFCKLQFIKFFNFQTDLKNPSYVSGPGRKSNKRKKGIVEKVNSTARKRSVSISDFQLNRKKSKLNSAT